MTGGTHRSLSVPCLPSYDCNTGKGTDHLKKGVSRKPTRRLQPQILNSLSTKDTSPTTFDDFKHLLFNKTSVSTLYQKQKHLESRFWAPSRDQICRKPAEVCQGQWTEHLPTPVEPSDSSKLGECFGLDWRDSLANAYELFEFIIDFLKKCESAEENLNKVWDSFIWNQLESHYRLAEASLSEDLEDSVRREFHHSLHNPASGSINESLQTKCLRKRHSLFKCCSVTRVKHPMWFFQNEIPTWQFHSSLVIQEPLFCDDFILHRRAFDLQTLEPVHLMCYMWSYTNKHKTSWVKALNTHLTQFFEPSTLSSDTEVPIYVEDFADLKTSNEVEVCWAEKHFEKLLNSSRSFLNQIIFPYRVFLSAPTSKELVSENDILLTKQINVISTFKRGVRLSEINSLDCASQRWYIWSLCQMVQAWEKKYLDLKVILPIHQMNIWFSGPLLFLYCGLTIAVQVLNALSFLELRAITGSLYENTTPFKSIPEHCSFLKTIPSKWLDLWHCPNHHEWKKLQRHIHAILILKVYAYMESFLNNSAM